VIRTAVDFLGYMACWWAAILGAAHGRPWAGPAAALVYLFLHLKWIDPTPAAGRRVVWGTVAGCLVEQGNLMVGVTAYAGAPFFAPAWMVGLWAAFFATSGVSMAWLRGRVVLAAILGAVAGPLTFMAGERLGALILGPWAPAALAVEWAVATAWLARRGRIQPE
jgi:hypothetical protein